jgi:hypothetical protein
MGMLTNAANEIIACACKRLLQKISMKRKGGRAGRNGWMELTLSVIV